MERVLYWFRNDLRLDDNPQLNSAVQSAESIAFIYIHDPRLWQTTCAGIPRLGWHRRRFLAESLQDLREELEKRGFELQELWGKPETLIVDLMAENHLSALYFTRECAPEEQSVENALLLSGRSKGFKVNSGWTQFLIGPDNLPFPLQQIPQKFTDFRIKVESAGLHRCVSTEEAVSARWGIVQNLQLRGTAGTLLGQLHRLASISVTAETTPWWYPSSEETQLLDRIQKKNFPDEKSKILRGGMQAGQKRMQDYIFNTLAVRDYFQTRNGLLKPNDSTLFSAWLANGSLSARQIFWALKQHEEVKGANKSTYWVVFELLWREFFKLHVLRHGAAFFHPNGLFKVRPPEAVADGQLSERIETLLSCKTQEPFVNANMRELVQTGFMSNRGRQNVASFMIYNLLIPWIHTAWIFESLLLDYDVASNWGNCAYIAGVSFDPRGGRHFNVKKQSQDYDPHGHYTSAWLI